MTFSKREVSQALFEKMILMKPQYLVLNYTIEYKQGKIAMVCKIQTQSISKKGLVNRFPGFKTALLIKPNFYSII